MLPDICYIGVPYTDHIYSQCPRDGRVNCSCGHIVYIVYNTRTTIYNIYIYYTIGLEGKKIIGMCSWWQKFYTVNFI